MTNFYVYYMSVTLFVVRHGETEENKLRILQGHMPGTLTAQGKEQAAAVGVRLAGETFDLMYCSDLQRCKDTAAIMNEALHLPVVYTPLLRERDWGRSTGVSLLKERVPIDPSAESVEAMFVRAQSFLRLLLEKHSGQRILVVSHGLFLRILISVIEGEYYKKVRPLENTEVRTFVVDHLPSGDELQKDEQGATAN